MSQENFDKEKENGVDVDSNNVINDGESHEALHHFEIGDEENAVDDTAEAQEEATNLEKVQSQNNDDDTLHNHYIEIALEIFRKQWTPDDPISISEGGHFIIDSSFGVKLIKFLALCLLGLVLTHSWVRSGKKGFNNNSGWEHDSTYTLTNLFLIDFHTIVLDLIAFFVLGRVFQRSGVDCLWPNIFSLIVGAVFPTISSKIGFLQHSISLYEIHCTWPWQLFVFATFVIISISYIISIHIKSALQDRILVPRLFEITFFFLIFFGPVITNPNFHPHHWLIGFFLGMIANQKYEFSRATQFFCLGLYLNGIAVYGRDPILGCFHSYYSSYSSQCHYLDCYRGETDGVSVSGYKPLVVPDWRTCNADDLFSDSTKDADTAPTEQSGEEVTY